ncbi:MAG: RES family NAD+ phosphorylase, partial [Ferruginibacter sp.]
ASDLTGEGARLYGGRWNHPLSACIYTSESRALAVLEYTVNVNIDNIARALSITSFEIPDTAMREFKVADLPGNWRDMPSPSSTKDFGTTLLKTATAPVFKMPSAVITEEFNYLLNPTHIDGKYFRIVGVVDFVYDVRIKLA